ncbi:MAG TPA: EF-hand domain-containing protein [Methylotenera sp.]|nr:EF-hand domain-containing protein [Methylotenera sp.]
MKFQLKSSALVVATLLSTAVLSTPAFSAEPMLSTGGYTKQFQKMEMMKMLDADGNNTVTATEADAYYDSIFTALDKDADGTVDKKEWTGPSNKSKLDLATGGYSRELRSKKMMGLMDKDGDHKVTKEEFLAGHKAIFTQMDTSGDSELSAQEWVAKHVGGQ